MRLQFVLLLALASVGCGHARVTLHSGEVLRGRIGDDTQQSVVAVEADGVVRTFAREEVQSVSHPGTSLLGVGGSLLAVGAVAFLAGMKDDEGGAGPSIIGPSIAAGPLALGILFTAIGAGQHRASIRRWQAQPELLGRRELRLGGGLLALGSTFVGLGGGGLAAGNEMSGISIMALGSVAMLYGLTYLLRGAGLRGRARRAAHTSISLSGIQFDFSL